VHLLLTRDTSPFSAVNQLQSALALVWRDMEATYASHAAGIETRDSLAPRAEEPGQDQLSCCPLLDKG
jgi:hypothetical protein